jgi:RHS repeat-associated protein
MASPRQLGRSALARLLAPVLIAALLVSLVPPPRAEASIPRVRLTAVQPVEDLVPSTPASPPLREVLICVVLLVVADPVSLTKSAFGELLAHTGTDPQPYAFTGEPLDPNSGFQYHRARWMDPRNGRFASVDPWAGGAAEPRSLHKYMYAGDNPINSIDPTGHFEFSVGGITFTASLQDVLRGVGQIMVGGVRRDRRWDPSRIKG